MDLTGAAWRKSSHSEPNGGRCVEIAAWRKSSHSEPNGGQCVEVAEKLAFVAVRDSKNPHGPALTFSRSAWRTFTTQLSTADAPFPRGNDCMITAGDRRPDAAMTRVCNHDAKLSRHTE